MPSSRAPFSDSPGNRHHHSGPRVHAAFSRYVLIYRKALGSRAAQKDKIINSRSHVMKEVPRKKTLEELKNEAIAELEHRGYAVRGKTPAQIRELLRRRPKKPDDPDET